MATQKAPVPLNPDADTDVGDWLTDNNSPADLHVRVADSGVPDDSTFIYTNALANPTGVVILLILDDWNKNALYGTIKDGFGLPGRAGTRVFENLWTEVIEAGTDFRAHIATYGPCWPTRAEIWTSNYRNNHKVRANVVGDWTDHYVDGIKEAVNGRPAQWAGPWGTTNAATLPGTRVDVTDPSHAALLRDGDDDAQAFTGSWIHELGRNDIRVFSGGKWDPWEASQPLCAGVDDAQVQQVNSGAQWTSVFTHNLVANPWDGPGVGGTANPSEVETTSHSYSRGSGTVTWSAANGGELVVTAMASAHLFDVGDIAGLKSTTNPAFTGYTYTVSRIINSTSFAVTQTSDPGGSSASATVYNRLEYPIHRIASFARDFIDDSRAAGKSAFLYLSPHIPHETGLGTDGFGQSYEEMYDGAVDLPVGGLWFDGVEADVSGTSRTPPSAGQLDAWQAIMQMCASVDDALGTIISHAHSVYGHRNVTVFVTGDQGNQDEEQFSRGNGSIKTAIWQGSASPPMFAAGPHFEGGARQLRTTSHADIGLTVLDQFGLYDNHMHDDRDGCSWIGGGGRPSIFDPSHIAYGRVVPVYGTWKTTGDAPGYVANNHRKYVAPGTGAVKHYDVRLPSDGGDYETAEGSSSAVSTPTVSEAVATQAAIDAARWDPATNTHPAHDGTIVQ